MLVLHLPLTGDIHNQGLLEEETYRAQDLTYSDNGKLGKCLQFNGDPKQILSFVNIPKKKNNFTWACWIKQTNRTSTVYQKTTQYVLSMGRDCGTIGFNIRMINGYLNIHLGSGEDTDATTSITNKAITIQELQLNIWYHICCIVDNESVNVYINGELVKTFLLVDISYRSNSYGYFTIGKMGYNNNNTSAYFPFNGLIQDVRVYDTAISPRQIKEISKGLVCHYPLGEVDGKIGGRNLIKNGKGNVKAGFFKNFPTVTDEYGEFTLKSKKTYKGIILDGFVYECRDYPVGEKYTWSYDIMYTAWNFPTGSNRGELWMGQRYVNAPSGETATGAWRGVTQHNLPVVGQNGCELNKWYHVKQTVTIPQQASSNVGQQGIISFYNSNANVEASFTARLKNVKLEKSSTATPWTPAPEDNTSFYNNIIYDTSGYCNNGSVTDSTCPTWSSDTCRYKGSYAFNGNKQYVNCGTSTMIDGQEEITINCWAYMNDWTNFNARLFSCTESGGYNTEGVNSSIKFALNVFTTSDKSKYAYTSTIGGYPGIKLSDMASGWHMITCVYKASVGDAIYLDGKLYEKKIYTSYGIHFNKYSYLFLGGESAGVNCIAPYFNGKLSDFRIYATALSDSNILELYQSSASVDNNGNLMLTGEVIEE